MIQVVLERFPSGAVGVWSDTASSATGSVTPIRTYRSESGIYCREFISVIEGTSYKVREEAVGCRTGDGVWEIYR